ncbi:MAG TPA: amidohydrolase family protein [Steroidobacter sp.]
MATPIGVSLAAVPERYVILDADGGKAGDIEISARGSGQQIVWDSKNNGRGTETREQLELDTAGLPKTWRIETKTDLGGTAGASSGVSVTTFDAKAGKAEWTIGSNTESRKLSSPMIFAPADASPWALGVYARALLKQSGLTLASLPTGSLKLEKLRDETVAGQAVSVYLLHGPDRRTETLRLDERGGLVAVGDGRVVRSGREDVAKALREEVRAKERAAHLALQKQLLHVFDAPVRIRNVRIFDPVSGKLGAPSSVIFSGDKITGVEPLSSSKPGETVIDGAGGTLIPGLHDTHFHVSLGGPEGSWLSLAAGVTTARDMGSNNETMAQYRADVAAGRLPGPRIIPSGMIEGASPFSLKSSGFLVESEADALKAVRWYADHGYWQIKIYNSVNHAWVPAMAREAHTHGLRVAGHIPAFSTADEMIDAGYDEVIHANQLMLGWVLKPGEDTRTPIRLTAMSRFADLDLNSAPVQKTLNLMQSKRIAFEPTLAIMRRLVMNRTGQVEPADQWWFSHLPKDFKPGRMITVLPGFTIMPIKTPADDAAYNTAAAKMIEVVRMMNARGIRVFAGSDDNNGFVLQRELELLTEAGMTPTQVLTRATLESAEYLGGGAAWGTIAPGKSADFFLVPGDPTAHIKAIHSVRMTVAQGRVYFPSEIYRALGVKPFVEPPKVLAGN